ncbi:ABC transporter ATP-binding protein [Roseibium sp. HPY-6]|uniref:ABC transporter ATP-binding protein n=1 Tax=Roseibium sp. HPY-6 TaxID=3229852 RepID=UPI0033905AB2
MTEPLLDIRNLRVSIPTDDGTLKAVRGVDLQVNAGETLCLVGESGCGKSMTANAIMGLLPRYAIQKNDGFSICGTTLNGNSATALRRLRGTKMAMIFQDPTAALNPTLTIGKQLTEAVIRFERLSRKQANARAIDMLGRVGITRAASRLPLYPHEFSGGQRQRIMIAQALMCRPKLLIADEPTTALDVTIQAQILRLLKDLQEEMGLGLLFITHDLGVVAAVATEVAVMFDGQIIERAPRDELFRNPAHHYTQKLLKAIPTPGSMPRRQLSRMSPPVIEVDSIAKAYHLRRGMFKEPEKIVAVDQLSIELHEGETLGLVGESGSGKSTALNMILGLRKPDAGEVRIDGRPIEKIPVAERVRLIQPVFQNPNASLNPMRRIRDLVTQPLRLHGVEQNNRDVDELLERIGLKARLANAYPGELSGGQRQRVAIARALVLRPRVLICDEPTSALDVSVQAEVIKLLLELRRDLNLTMIFVSHDLSVVQHLSDRIAVMYLGRKVEEATTRALFDTPQHPYTRSLLGSMLTLGADGALPDLPTGNVAADSFVQ